MKKAARIAPGGHSLKRLPDQSSFIASNEIWICTSSLM